MNDITYAVSVDVNNPIIPYNVYIASVLDSNVRYLEITLYQNGNVIALSNTATATASLVTDNVLVDDSVNCAISDNIITVPLEGLQRHGNLDVQVTVTEGTKVLAIPFPIQVRVTPNIAEEAQIDDDSLGSYAEVVREIAAARGGYSDLKGRIDSKEDKSNKAVRITSSNIGSGTNYPTVAAVAQYLGANYYNKNDIDDSTYTKSEVDTALAAKANTADVNTALAAKAEKSTVDSITENPDFFVLNSQTLGGVTVTNNGDGTYTFDSEGAVTDATVLFPSFPLPAGAYTAEIETLPGGSSEAYSGGGAALVAIKFGTGDGTTWVKADDDPASKTFAADTIIFFRLNRGTYNNLKLKISITKNNHITAVDSVARDTAGFTQEQLRILSGKYSARESAFYPLAEPDGFTWKNSPLHGKILTDFRGNYQVDFDVSNCKNPIGKAYYVAPNGSDSNDGTPGAPFASISKAYTEGADTIYLYPGIYDRTQTLYTPTTGSNSKPITRNINIIGLGSGAILSTKVVNIVNVSEYPTEGTGVWECYANNTTYLTNVVDIKNKTADGHFTKYTQLSSVSAVQAAAGSWALVNGKAYIHTIDGNKPVNGDNVLFLHSTNPTFANNQYTVIYPLFYVTGGKVYFENLTCIEGTTPLLAQRQANGSDIEIYAKNCNFFYSRTEDHDVVMLQGTTLSIFQNCEASFGMKDGFNYHARSGITPKAVEINCIGIGNGNISDGNDQGSTIHDGGSIIRVRDVCAHNYGANYSDQGTGTESWNIGCVGFESWCPSNGQNADFFALLNTKMFLDGCVSFGSKHNFNYASPVPNTADAAGEIYLRCIKENVANKVTSISSASTDEQYPSAKAVYDAIDSAIASQTTDLSAAVVTLSESSYTYDGTSKVPSVTSVTLNGQTLTAGTDYAVVSSPATNAGSYTLTVNGIGDYSGTVTANWTINKAQATISGADSISVVGIGESESEIYTTTGDGALSFSISDSSVATVSSSGGQVTVTGVAAGSTTLTVTVADGTNYTGTTKTVSLQVTEASTATVFGNVWDYSLSSPGLTRLTAQTDPLGVVTDCPATHPSICRGSTQGQSDFDNYLPWSGMVRKNYVNGQVIDFTGYDNGETYVYIPPFWSKIVDDSEHSKMYFYISSEELTGFTKHPGSDRYVGRYQCDTNFESKPNGKPKIPFTLDEFKTGITAIDNNHQPYDIHTCSAICLLYLIELNTFDSQTRVGPGFIDSYTPFNMGSTDVLTYHTGNCYIRNGNEQIQYRWIEGLWGNAMELINGILVSNNEIYICDDITKYSSSLTSDYEDTGLSLPTGADYITALHCFNNCYIFPKAASSGSSSTYVCDGIYNDSNEAGVRAVRVGGAPWQKTNVGLFTFNSKFNANDNNSASSRPILIIPNGGDSE